MPLQCILLLYIYCIIFTLLTTPVVITTTITTTFIILNTNKIQKEMFWYWLSGYTILS